MTHFYLKFQLENVHIEAQMTTLAPFIYSSMFQIMAKMLGEVNCHVRLLESYTCSYLALYAPSEYNNMLLSDHCLHRYLWSKP